MPAPVSAPSTSAHDRGERLRQRVWRPTEPRVRLLTELSLLADEAVRDVYVRGAAVAVAEHVGGACIIALHAGASDVPSVASHVSQSRAVFRQQVVPFAEMARHVLVTGRDLFMTEHHERALVVPLRARGRVLGALGAVTDTRVSSDDVRYLDEVGARVAITVEYLRLDSGGGQNGAAPAPAPASAPVPALTARERQVLGCVAAGMTSRETGAQLFISKRTVEWHRERIKEKLGVSSRVALTRAARGAGLDSRMT